MTWPGATSMVKWPCTSVTAPLVVPFITMLAPMMGSPWASVTCPLTVLRCCCISVVARLEAGSALAVAAPLVSTMAANAVAAKNVLAFTVLFR